MSGEQASDGLGGGDAVKNVWNQTWAGAYIYDLWQSNKKISFSFNAFKQFWK